MWKNKKPRLSIVDCGSSIDGTLSADGRLVIKGTVRGVISGETVIIAREGCVYADITGSSVTIGGVFEGQIEADGQVVILASGNCSGKVVCRDIVVENGGILNAEVSSAASGKMESETAEPREEESRVVSL